MLISAAFTEFEDSIQLEYLVLPTWNGFIVTGYFAMTLKFKLIPIAVICFASHFIGY